MRADSIPKDESRKFDAPPPPADVSGVRSRRKPKRDRRLINGERRRKAARAELLRQARLLARTDVRLCRDDARLVAEVAAEVASALDATADTADVIRLVARVLAELRDFADVARPADACDPEAPQ